MKTSSTKHVNEMQDADFATLIKGHNDRAEPHVVWIDRHGTVHCQGYREMCAGCESLPAAAKKHGVYVSVSTLAAGNGYVGRAAAADGTWLERLRLLAQEKWARAEAARAA